jgi:hypothetical protein
MILRSLFVLLKSALMVALLEFLSSVGEAIGFQVRSIATVATAISQATVIPHKEAEALFLLVLVMVLSEAARVVWNVITG